MHPVTISVSPQVVVLIVVLLILILVALRIAGSRRRRRTGGDYRPGVRHAGVRRTRKHDHGLEIAHKHGRHERSPEWPRVEKEHLLHEPACVACGHRGKGLQVHHIKPFHLHPSLELDPRNLITLCEIKGRDHHLLLGHLDDWEAYNPNVRDDVKRFHGKTALQIRANTTWQKEVAKRPFH